MTKKLFIIALAAGLFAAPAFSYADSVNNYDYGRGYNPDVNCQQSVNNNAIGGGAVGAAIGAIAGSQIAGRGNRTDGSALGAVVGAVIGSQIGKNRIACDDRYQQQRNNRTYGDYNNGYNNRTYGEYEDNNYNRGYSHSQYNNGYQQDDYYRPQGVRYSPPMNRGYNNRCGWGTAAYSLPNGRVTNEQVYMCQRRDGDWVITNR